MKYASLCHLLYECFHHATRTDCVCVQSHPDAKTRSTIYIYWFYFRHKNEKGFLATHSPLTNPLSLYSRTHFWNQKRRSRSQKLPFNNSSLLEETHAWNILPQLEIVQYRDLRRHIRLAHPCELNRGDLDLDLFLDITLAKDLVLHVAVWMDYLYLKDAVLWRIGRRALRGGVSE